ncbi:MAG: efflux RND transporter periplasmic adaptor subunit [Betaproteobacteria bacterium]|nr:efflux RND transporter periplasmic adaptor subunit [Betaproteobacteria bacterium]
MKRTHLHGLSRLGCVVVCLALTACERADSQPSGGRPPPEVSVVEVQPRDLPAAYEYVGQTAGSRDVEVRARVTGILLKRNYREGAAVKRGQSLFTIDPAPFQIALQRADAELAAAEARLDQARRNSARLKPLAEAKAASQKDYDDAVAAERIASADVKLAHARLAEAKLNLEWTRVEAPIAGLTSRASQSEGTLVSGPNVLLTTITQVDPIWVTFGIPEREHLAIRKAVDEGRLKLPGGSGFDVKVRLSDGAEYAPKGRLDFTDVRLNPATGTTETRAELPNPGGRLRPGQFVRVVLSGAMRPNAIAVPQRAVLDGPQGKFVYLVDAQSKVEMRLVEVGDWQGDDWIIHKGLATGDKVIVAGLMKIGPGAPVRIASPDATKPGAPKPPAEPSPAKK